MSTGATTAYECKHLREGACRDCINLALAAAQQEARAAALEERDALRGMLERVRVYFDDAAVKREALAPMLASLRALLEGK